MNRVFWLLTILLLAVGFGGCAADGPTMIRVHNVSSYDYEELQVGEETYGTLPAGEYTEYREFGVAYRYNYVSLRIGADEFVLQPIDYVGETPLGDGEFTYEVDVSDYDARALSIEAVPE